MQVFVLLDTTQQTRTEEMGRGGGETAESAMRCGDEEVEEKEGGVSPAPALPRRSLSALPSSLLSSSSTWRTSSWLPPLESFAQLSQHRWRELLFATHTNTTTSTSSTSTRQLPMCPFHPTMGRSRGGGAVYFSSHADCYSLCVCLGVAQLLVS